MKIYISGKITGLPLHEAENNFMCAAIMLKLKGYESVNPFDIMPYDEKLTWRDYMLADIGVLMQCDAIYMLSDWGLSKGARIEYQIAKEMGLKVFFQGEFN